MCDVAQRLEDRGIQKGIKQGIQKGIQKGRQEERLKIVQSLVEKGMPVAEIADILKVSEKDVGEMIKTK